MHGVKLSQSKYYNFFSALCLHLTGRPELVIVIEKKTIAGFPLHISPTGYTAQIAIFTLFCHQGIVNSTISFRDFLTFNMSVVQLVLAESTGFIFLPKKLRLPRGKIVATLG